MSQILNVDETRKQQCFSAIKGTLALTQRLHDVCTHSSLPTSAILALGLLEKKDDEQFRVGGDNAF